jgi:hypothetical protein
MDPRCPDAPDIDAVLDDPMTEWSGVGDEVVAGLERDHVKSCRRCQEYGTANLEVTD